MFMFSDCGRKLEKMQHHIEKVELNPINCSEHTRSIIIIIIKISDSKYTGTVYWYSEDSYVTGSEWGRMQHRRLRAERCQPCCSFIYPPIPASLNLV